MKYLKFTLQDGTPVKFRLRTYDNSLIIQWKYSNTILDDIKEIFCLHYLFKHSLKELDLCSNEELVDIVKDKIYKEHLHLQSKKRTIYNV